MTMHPRGAMIRDLALRLPGGRWLHPLHRAPWVGTADGDEQPGLMAGLAGEWPCIPFGMPGEPLPADWRPAESWEDPFPHGYAANHDWDLRPAAGGIEARIALPSTHPIAWLERRAAPVPGGVALGVIAMPRRDARLPIGLHPVFRLPRTVGAMRIDIAGAQTVFTHPADPQPDPSPLVPGAMFPGLRSVTDRAGRALDLSCLPVAQPCEIRVLVRATGGRVRLTDLSARTVLHLDYDALVFPAVMLWISNGGRAGPPWNGRHYALGVEPVAAAFDLGVGASRGASPLAARGLRTTHDFRAGQLFRTAIRLTAARMR